MVSAQVHLLAWRISGLRTQLLCGNQGDNCCQATTGLDQCAYTVKKQQCPCLRACTTLKQRNPSRLICKIIHLLHTAWKLQTCSLALQQHLCTDSPCCRNGLHLGLFCHYRQKDKHYYSFSTLEDT